MMQMSQRHACEDRPASPDRIPWGLILEGLFLVYAMAILIHLGNTSHVRTLAITFVGIVLEALPFMLIGALVGGFIEGFLEKVQSIGISATT